MAMDIRKMLSHVKERTLGKELEDMICVAYFEETRSEERRVGKEC